MLKLNKTYGNTYEMLYDKLSNNSMYINNPELFQKDWETVAKSGRLDTFIYLLSDMNKIQDKEKFKQDYKWGDFSTTETRLLSLHNEIYKKENEKEIIENYLPKYDKDGNPLEINKNDPSTYVFEKINRYEYNKRIINENWNIKYQQHLRDVEQQRKDDINGFVKHLATIAGIGTEFGVGFLKQIDNLSSTIGGIIEGIESSWTEESFTDAYVRSVSSQNARFIEKSGLFDAIDDFERRYTYLKDLDGNYTTAGKYLGGIPTSLGQMLPSLLVSKGLKKIKVPPFLIKTTSSATFYVGITTERIRETYNEMALKEASVTSTSILTNAITKSILEYAVELILGKMLGGSVFDNLVFGRKTAELTGKTLTKAAKSRILHDFSSEGLEELFQDTASYFVDKAWARLFNSSYGVDTKGNPLNLDYVALMDSFIIGGLTSIVGSAKSIISTKKLSLGYKTDDKGNLILDKKGKPIEIKLGKLASWEYGLDLQSFVENCNDIINTTNKLVSKGKWGYMNDTKEHRKITAAFTEMYAAYRMLASVYNEIGDERFKHANDILNTISQYEKRGRFDVLTLPKISTFVASDAAKSLREQLFNMPNLARTKFLNKLKEAQVTNIVNSLTKGEIDALPEGETKDALRELMDGDKNNKVIAITEGNTKPINEEGITAVSKEEIKTHNTRAIYATIAEEKLVETILSEDHFVKYVDQIYYSYKEFKGKDVSKEEAIRDVIFDKEFFIIMLNKSNTDMYNFLTSIIAIEKAVVTEDIKTEEYKNKLNIVIENMKKALIEYLSNRTEITDAIYNNDLLNEKEISYIKNQQYNKGLYQRLINDGYDKLSDSDKTNIDNKVNNALIKQRDKDIILNNIKSVDINTRKSAIDRLNTIYKGIFTNEYDGKTYMPQTSVANGAFNSFLKSLNLTIDKLRTRASDSEIQAIIEMFGEFNENNLIAFRQKQFEEAQNNYLTFRYDDKGKIGIFVKESGKQVGYALLNKFLNEEENIYNEKSTHIERESKKNNEVSKLLNDSISNAYAATLSINDVIMSPNMLKDNIKNEIIRLYGKLNSITTYLYLRDYFLSKYKTMTIIVLQNGTFAFGNVQPMIKVFKGNYKTKIREAINKLSNKPKKLKDLNIIKDKYFAGRLNDINIVLFDSIYEWGRYDADSNTIYLSEEFARDEDSEIFNHICFTILHEFQHAIQFENNMNIGANTNIIDKLSINDRRKLTESIKKHRPELFVDVTSARQEREVIDNFIYNTSGESMANGLDASKIIDFFPTIVRYEGINTVIQLPWGDEFSINGYISNSSLIYRNNEKIYTTINKNFLEKYLSFAGKYDEAFNEGLNTYFYEQIDNLNNIQLANYLDAYINQEILSDEISNKLKQDIKNNITNEVKENSIYKLYKTILDYNTKNNIENTLSYEEFKNIDVPITRLQRLESKTIEDNNSFVSFNISAINNGFFNDVLYKTKGKKDFNYRYNMFFGTIKLKDCLFVTTYDKTLEVLIEPKYVKNFQRVSIDLSSLKDEGKTYIVDNDLRRSFVNTEVSNFVYTFMPNINRELKHINYTSLVTNYINDEYVKNNVETIKNVINSDENININKDVLIDICLGEGININIYTPEVERTILDYINTKLDRKYKNLGFYNLLRLNGYTKSFNEFQNDRFVYITNSQFVTKEYNPNLIGANIVSCTDNIPFYINNMIEHNLSIGMGTIKGSDIKFYSSNRYNTALIDTKNSETIIIDKTNKTFLNTGTSEEKYYMSIKKPSTRVKSKVEDEKKIIYNTTGKGEWIYKKPILDKEGNVVRNTNGTIKYKHVYDEKKYSKRKVSQKSQKSTNMEKFGYTRKYKQTQMSPSLIKFINEATEDIDETLWNAIKNGKINKQFITTYIYETDNMSQKTFDLINRCFFNNSNIKSFEQLLDLVDKTPDYTAAYRILNSIDKDKLAESDDIKLYDKALALIQSNETYLKTYLRLTDNFDVWKEGKDSIDINVDIKGMRYNFLKMYDGTLKQINHIAVIAREAAYLGWKITGKGNKLSGTISLDINTKGGVSNAIGTNQDIIEALNSVDSVTEREDKVDTIMKVMSKDIIYKLISEGKGKNLIATYLADLRKSYENMSQEMFNREYAKIVDKMSDEEIDKAFNASITIEQAGIEIDKLDENQLDVMTDSLNKIDTERRAPNIVNNIRTMTNTINRNLAPNDYKRFLADNNDIFIVENNKIKFNTNKFKNERGLYLDNIEKELLAVEKRVSSLNNEIKKGKYSSNFAKKEKNKLYKEVEKLKAENDILKVKLSGKDAKTKIIKVNDDVVTIETEKEVPYVLQKLLETEFTKTAKTEVQELAKSDEEHIVMNTATFVEDNAEFLNSLDQVAVDELVNFFASSSILPTTNKARQYLLTQIYTMTYLLATTKGNFILSEQQRNILEERLKFMISAGAAIPAAWRQALKILKPEVIIMKSIAKRTGINFEEETINKLINYIAKGDREKIKEVRKELYKQCEKQFKGKKVNFQEKFLQFERMMMLSGPGTWIRNQTSNLLITGLNRVNDVLGGTVVKIIDKLFPNRYKTTIRQYKITGTKVSTETQQFIKRELVDTGVFTLIKDGLGKYNYTEASKNTTVDNLAYLIVNQIETELFNKSAFKNEKLQKVHSFIYKMMSDDPYIQREAIRYLGKTLTEDNVDLSKGITRDVLEHIADAYLLAAQEFMHKKNIINLLESKLFERHPNVYFIYKQIFPFTAASYNWFVEGLNYTPIGLIKSIINYAKLENSIAKIVSKKAKGEKLPSTKFTEYTIRKNIGKGVIGSIGMIIGALLVALKGAGIDEEDEKYKLHIGDVYVDISDIFGTQGIFMGIALADTIIREKDGFKALTETFNVIFQDSIYSDFYNLFRYRENVSDFALYIPEQMLSAMIPNFVKTLSSIINVNKVKYEKSILGRLEYLLVQAIPGIAYAFPHYIDPYTGENQVAYKLQFLTNAINKLTPIDVLPYNVSDIEKEAISLGINKSMLTGKYSEITLSTVDTEELNKYYGKLNKGDLEDLYNNKTNYKILDEKTGKYKNITYSQMTDKEKATIIKRIMSNNSSLSKIYILTSKHNYKYYANENEYKELINLGLKNIYKETDKLKGFVK